MRIVIRPLLLIRSVLCSYAHGRIKALSSIPPLSWPISIPPLSPLASPPPLSWPISIPPLSWPIVNNCDKEEERLWPPLPSVLLSRSRPHLLASVPSLLFSCWPPPPLASLPSLLSLTRSRRSLLSHGRRSPLRLSSSSSSLWLSAMLSPLASGNREATWLPSFALLPLCSSASPPPCQSLSLLSLLALC